LPLTRLGGVDSVPTAARTVVADPHSSNGTEMYCKRRDKLSEGGKKKKMKGTFFRNGGRLRLRVKKQGARGGTQDAGPPKKHKR